MPPLSEETHTVVIGAGFAGLEASLRLKEAGVEHIILERGQKSLGTWRQELASNPVIPTFDARLAESIQTFDLTTYRCPEELAPGGPAELVGSSNNIWR